jgi:hypothetical protein
VNLSRKYQKALETILYVANKDQRHYWILKAIYFADKEHLSKYGRQIFDDTYRAMKQGPVPSLAYDIVKFVRGDGWYSFGETDAKSALMIPDKYTVNPTRPADIELLSQTDMECLDNALNLIKDLSFSVVKELSHDDAYNKVNQDEEISIETIISTLNNCNEIADYQSH